MRGATFSAGYIKYQKMSATNCNHVKVTDHDTFRNTCNDRIFHHLAYDHQMSCVTSFVCRNFHAHIEGNTCSDNTYMKDDCSTMIRCKLLK